jgi:hypothetical protein
MEEYIISKGSSTYPTKDDDTMLQPNQNYRIYLSGEAMPETKAKQGQSRSSCL